MKYRRLLRLSLIVLALLLCAGIALYARLHPAEHTQGITLWYTAGDCPAELMENLLAAYRQESGCWVEGVCFADEQAIGAAFETGRPDLLLCSHIRAAQLDARESLSEIAAPPPVMTGFEPRRPALGRSFFPIGSRLPLLLVNTALEDREFTSFEALLDAAGDEPFLACDCWAAFLYTETLSAGQAMTGLAAEDAQNAVYAALYNRLAEAAFRGALPAAADAADRVRLGQLPCAVVLSTELAGVPQGDQALRVLPLPLPEDGERKYPAELMGFALLGGADTEAASGFLNWLWHGRRFEAAIAMGLVPFAQADTGSGADGPLGALLTELAADGALTWPDAEEPFSQNRDACERRLRDTLDLLA